MLKALSHLTIKFKKLHPDAKTPTHAYELDAGWDFYALEDIQLPALGIGLVPTGIAIEMPKSIMIEKFDGGVVSLICEAQMRPRSSLRLKNVLVTLGTIDAGYHGDVSAIVVNYNSFIYTVEKGEKICQVVVALIPFIKYKEEKELSTSDRGEKGFGSSDQKK